MARAARKVVECRMYDLPLEFPVLLLDGAEWLISDVMSNRLHFHNCLEIGICHSDSGMLVFENETLHFRTGDISCIPRHCPHTTCSTKGTRSRWSYLFVDLDSLLGDMVPPGTAFTLNTTGRAEPHYLINRDEYARIHFLVMSIIEELQDKKANYRAVTKSLFLAVYYELLRLQKEQPGTEPASKQKAFSLAPALEFIHTQYMNSFSVDELAEMCHLSATHFRRLFQSVMGTSPLNFITTTRINHACVMLLTTYDSILSISEAVGFSSISSFNRSFAQIMGTSPRNYRNPETRESLEPSRKYVLHFKGWMKPELQPETIAEDPR